MDALPGEITRLLGEWRAGKPGALEALTPLVYDELKSIASAYMRREASEHTLQPTALVNEAYLRLAGDQGLSLNSRSHFYAIAARLMRQVLVDHARRHLSGKRGGGMKAVPLNEAVAFVSSDAASFIALNSALDRLQKLDERKARAVELRYFGGLSVDETASALNVSTLTIYRDLRFAEAWMLNELTTGVRDASA
jgi:RNA polymerase sigma-70 factor (ECF subfamily)